MSDMIMKKWKVKVGVFGQTFILVINATTCDEAVEIAYNMAPLDLMGAVKIEDICKWISCAPVKD